MVDILAEWEQIPGFFPTNTPIFKNKPLEWEDSTGSEDVQPGDLCVFSAEGTDMEVSNIRNKLPPDQRDLPKSELKTKLKKPKKNRA